MNNHSSLQIAIVGTGGTGGILGTYLSRAGHQVTYIARGAHLAALQEKGLTLHTAHRGTIHLPQVKACTMDNYHATPDIMLICVKYYSLPDAIRFVRQHADKHTLIIPVLNVFGTGAVMQKALPHCTVLDGCIYIYGMVEAPGVIAQPAPILRLFYGFRNNQPHQLTDLANFFAQALQAAGIEAHYTSTIERDALQKFSFVSPLGAAGLYYNAVCGDFMQKGPKRELFAGLVKEIEDLGHAMGLSFPCDLVKENLQLLDAFTPDLHTSMQRDVAKGGPSEFSGLVHRAAALGQQYKTPMPLYDKLSHWGRKHQL